MGAMRQALPRHTMLIALIACGAILIAGCGGSSAPQLDDKPRPQGPPTRQARAVETQLDALAANVAPVTDRMNYLVAVEQLHALDIADGSAGASVVERRQDVLAEIHRYRELLVRASRLLAAQKVKKSVRPMRASARRVVRFRLTALRSLEASLSKEAQNNDAARSLQHQQWVTAWDQSIGAARGATNEGQAIRAHLGLQADREDAFR